MNNVGTIVAFFNHFDSKPKWYKDGVNALLAEYDRITGNKKISSWIRFANSLKLRMAMNVVKAEPELARKWAEEAVAAGVVDEASQQIRLAPIELGFVNPLLMISNTWNDTRLNASLETILKSYNHPMLEFLFSKNSDPIISDDDNKITPAESMIVGLRSGISMMSGQSYDVNFRTAYSGIRETIVEMPLFIIRLAEMDFLRAEGALRGWNMGGSAEQFYNRGIQEAFEGTNLKDFNEDYTEEIIFDKAVYPQALAGYMALEKAKDIVYVDPAYKAHNAQSLVAVGVKWNEGDNDETKLEKIMTQKYIAFFPYSFGAWNDLRRTGYPRIFPVLPEDTGDGSLSAGEIIRRIPFSASDEATKQDIATSGLKAIGGPDLQATRIWWDLPQSNF